MACCVLAAFLLAQFMAMLRRWAVFWGVMAPAEGEVADTIFTRTAAFLRRPVVRAAIGLLLVVELGAAGSWLYVRHGTHIAEEADIAWSRLHGEHVVYAGLCTLGGEDTRVRVVLDPATKHAG